MPGRPTGRPGFLQLLTRHDPEMGGRTTRSVLVITPCHQSNLRTARHAAAAAFFRFQSWWLWSCLSDGRRAESAHAAPDVPASPGVAEGPQHASIGWTTRGDR